MKKTISAGIVFIFLISFTHLSMNAQDFSLYDTKWQLNQLSVTGNLQEIMIKKAFIRFNEEKKSVGGNGSCNSFGGQFSIHGDSLSLGNIFSTKMYCEAVQETENNFFSLLRRVNRYQVERATLLLFHDNELLLQFTAATNP